MNGNVQLTSQPISREDLLTAKAFFRDAGLQVTQVTHNALMLSDDARGKVFKQDKVLAVVCPRGVLHKSQVEDVIDWVKAYYTRNQIDFRNAIAVLVVDFVDAEARIVLSLERFGTGFSVALLSTFELRDALLNGRTAMTWGVLLAILHGEVELYDRSTPISQPADFYGRSHEIREIGTLLGNGVPVGIFGLSRIGKTSLLLQLRQRQRDFIGIYVSLATGFSISCFAQEILDQARKEAGAMGVMIPHVSLTPSDRRSSRQRFKLSLRQLCSETGIRLAVLIDEADCVSHDDYWEVVEDLLELSRAGLSVVPLLCGIRPEFLEDPGIRDKAVAFRLLFLRPMPYAECAEMVSGIGQYMGIQWTNDGLEEVYNEMGGHTYMTRSLCSCVWIERESPDQRTFDDVAVRKARNRHSYSDYERQYLNSLFSMLNESQRHWLRNLVHSTRDAPLSSEERFAMGRLLDYGIIEEQDHGIRIRGQFIHACLLAIGA